MIPENKKLEQQIETLLGEVKELKENQIVLLKKSIERREKLLANPNYVNKAPEHIVNMDREKLEEEKKKLMELENN